MREFLRSCRFYFTFGFFFSLFINILQLTFPIYMLQIYDRVLSSYSVQTLVVITVGAIIALMVMALLENLRSKLLVRAGVSFDNALSKPVLDTTLKNSLKPAPEKDVAQLRDVQSLRNFLGGNAVFAFFDLPWTPIYLAIIYMLHPWLGIFAACGGLVVLILGMINHKISQKPLAEATMINSHNHNFMATCQRNVSVIGSMGMMGPLLKRWNALNNKVIELQTRASSRAGLLQSISKALRVGLQVGIYGIGAFLAINHEATPGAMIAASIIMGRALAPIDLGMATYKQSIEAWGSYKRIKNTLKDKVEVPPMDLPAPTGNINVENVSFGIQGRTILQQISFNIPAGETLGIIGPSAAGKSTLCRLMLGIWPANIGKVRLDGADIYSWDQEKLGQYIGYLPQDVELFAGSIAENIARMDKVDSDKVVEAAKRAGVHEMVLRFPNGYDTQIGEYGGMLSGGQRQRIGLARAIYGSPRLLVLDEPNSNLDDHGERALMQSILEMKNEKSTIVLVTHRPQILNIVDKVLVLQDGKVAMFGPKQDVIQKLSGAQGQQQQTAKQPRPTANVTPIKNPS